MKISTTAPSKTESSRRWRYIPWLLSLIIVATTVWYWRSSVVAHQQKVETDFSRATDHAVEIFRERFSFYQNLGFALQGLFSSSQEVTPDEWHRFFRALHVSSNYPGVESVYFAEYRQTGAAPGHPGTLARDASGQPVPQQGFSARVTHSDSVAGSDKNQGYDLATEPQTLEAMIASLQRQEAVLTPVMRSPFTGSTIVRLVLPSYRPIFSSAKQQPDQQEMLGWLLVNIDTTRWLDQLRRELNSSDYYFQLNENSGKSFYDRSPEGHHPRYRKEYRLRISGHDWNILFTSTPDFEKASRDPLIHLYPFSAISLTLLLLIFIRWTVRNEQRAELLAEQMTEELRRSESRYRGMFEANKAVELLIDPDTGLIVDANQAAVNYYGYSRDELRKMKISDINTLSEEEIRQEMKRAEQERRSHFMFRHRHATGEVRDVEVHSGPVEVEGKRLLYSIIHDVTDRVESEQALRESEERYHSIIDNAGEGYWLVDLNSLRIIEVNDALCRMLGYDRDDLIGLQPFDLVDEENSRIFAYQSTQFLHKRQRSYEVVLQHKDGHDVIVRIHATNMPHGGKAVTQAFAFITDITDWKRTEEQLRIAATFFDTTSEAITVTDADNRIVAVNPAFTLITGYSEEEAIGRDPSFLSSGRNNAAFYRNMWDTLMRMGRWQGEIWNRRKNGEIYPEWLSIVAIRDEKGVTRQYMAVFSDITKRKRDEEKIWRQANYDGLTGLPNRNLFKDRLDQGMHAAHRENTRLALLFIDLDRFKWVNDTLGHACGDLLLQEAANRLRGAVRETDTVARLGGDEFTVLLNEVNSSGDVDRIAEVLLRCLAEPFTLDGKEAFVSGSIGIALYPGDAADMEELLRNADAAMYTAKASGRNNFRYYTQEMNEAAQRRLKLEVDLRRALEREELSLHYQPIIDGHGKVAGAEALLRWLHPEYGFVAPDEFIPLAEEVGMIVPIEQWVMHQACADTVEFQRQYGRPIFVSVNVSSVQCKSDQCKRLLGSVLEETGLAPDCLKLEITERVMMENTDTVIALLREVREMGVRLAVDDFGTGYSSLSYLKQFPIDVLKIDRAFIDGLPHDKDDVALVEAIVAMAHSLNLQVVGEGVENSEQLAFLRSLGCDLIQGFHFSYPLPAGEFSAYLETH